MRDATGFTWVYIIGVLSCWVHSVGFWAGLFWPWQIGSVFAAAWGYQ